MNEVETICERCGCRVDGPLCGDETCPFSDHEQNCPVGWTGHPEPPVVGTVDLRNCVCRGKVLKPLLELRSAIIRHTNCTACGGLLEDGCGTCADVREAVEAADKILGLVTPGFGGN